MSAWHTQQSIMVYEKNEEAVVDSKHLVGQLAGLLLSLALFSRQTLNSHPGPSIINP